MTSDKIKQILANSEGVNIEYKSCTNKPTLLAVKFCVLFNDFEAVVTLIPLAEGDERLFGLLSGFID